MKGNGEDTMRRKTTVDHVQHIENQVLFRHSLKMRTERGISAEGEFHTFSAFIKAVTYKLKAAEKPEIL